MEHTGLALDHMGSVTYVENNGTTEHFWTIEITEVV